MSNHVKLSEYVSIANYYQKSVQLYDDLDKKEALSGYVCLETAKKLVMTMSQQLVHTNQRAFTWTGPFGSGKSTLALALSQLVRPGDVEENIAQLAQVDGFKEAFPKSTKGWAVLPIVGTRVSPMQAFAKVLGEQVDAKLSTKDDIFQALDKLAISHDGLFIIVDEMGKLLEGVDQSGEDIYFFQELAEFVPRSKGRIVFVGILHQAFRQYAKHQNFSEKVQNEWEKIQGRFSDIPLITTANETLELIGKAITSKDNPKTATESLCSRVVAALSSSKLSSEQYLKDALKKCWPLHPVTALLLGPASKKQYGQNERSVFGFLNSHETFGFQDFLNTTKFSESSAYTPARYWDYLEENLEPSIMASFDSQKWMLASSCIERVSNKGSALHVSLVKTIAVVELFSNGSGITASTALLSTVFSECDEQDLLKALEDLTDWKTVIFRKFNNSWSVFEGSDFDLNTALNQELRVENFDIKHTEKYVNFHPVVAKRHLHLTGSLRWMKICVSDSHTLKNKVSKFCSDQSQFGQFILLLDKDALSTKEKKLLKDNATNSVVGVPKNRSEIYALTKELSALDRIGNYPELEGDGIARKEVDERKRIAVERIKYAISISTINTLWHYKQEPDGRVYENISKLCSDMADKAFNNSPRIWSELINRDIPSTNSVKARRALLYRMLSSEAEQDLGIEGYPAEKGLYLTCIKATGIHTKGVTDNVWKFLPPTKNERNLHYLWDQTLKLIESKDQKVKVSDIYDLWQKPPFGVKTGLLPVLFWAFYLSYKSKLGLYKDSFYIAELTEVIIDESLQNISRFELQSVEITSERAELLTGLSALVADMNLSQGRQTSPLEAARTLVATVYRLPQWTKETKTLSRNTQRLRDELKRASDPHKVLFHDISAIYGTDNTENLLVNLKNSLEELLNAHQIMLTQLATLLLHELDVERHDVNRLNARAKAIKETGPSFLDNAFINRLINYDGSTFLLKDVLGLVVEKRVEEWTDSEVSTAKNRISEFSKRFRKLEAMAHIHGRVNERESIALVYSIPGKDLIETDIEVDKTKQQELASQVHNLLEGMENLSKKEKLAVIISALESLDEVVDVT